MPYSVVGCCEIDKHSFFLAAKLSRPQNKPSQMKGDIAQTQSWHCKTAVVIVRHQQKQHIKKI